MEESKENQRDLIERLTRESLARGYIEFPKMKHHPDGRTAIVNTDAEESALGGDWLPTPDAALKVRADRDESAAKREAAQIAKGNQSKGRE